jgi:hypothetical protein
MRYSTSPSRKTDRRASRPSYLIFRSRSITNTFSEKLCCCMNAHALADESVSAPPPNVFHLNSLCRSSSRSNCVDFWRMNSPAGAARHRCGVTGELCKTRTSRLAPGHLCCSSPFRVSGAAKGGLDAETQKLVDGDSRAGGARGALCNAGVTRELLYREAGEERAPPSQAAAWSWSAAAIKEQEGMRSDGKADEPWTQLATRIPRENFTVASGSAA